MRGSCGRTEACAQPPIAIKLKQILALAQVWDPKLIIAEFTGPLTASDIGGAPYVTATWGIAQASVRGTPKAPERASVVVDGLRLDGAQGNLFDSKRAEFHARVQYGSWPHNPAVDVVVKLGSAAAPAVHALAAQPFDADILAVVHGIKDLAPKPMPARLREWQAAGGRLEIQNARLAQADSLANATGTLALTQQGTARRRAAADGCRHRALHADDRRREGRLAQPRPCLRRRETRSSARCPVSRNAFRRNDNRRCKRDCWRCSGSRPRSRASGASRRRSASPTARPRSVRFRSDKCRRRSNLNVFMHDARHHWRRP